MVGPFKQTIRREINHENTPIQKPNTEVGETSPSKIPGGGGGIV